MHRRTLLAVAVFALSIAIVTSTGSFTSASVERGVSVAIAGDDNAWVGVEENTPELDNGNHEVVLMDVTNRFNSEMNLVVEKGEDDGLPPIITKLEDSQSIGVGQTISIKGSVTCSNSTTGGKVPVDLSVRNAGTSVDMTRGVWINCTGEPPANNSGQSTTSDQSANNSTDASHTPTQTAGS